MYTKEYFIFSFEIKNIKEIISIKVTTKSPNNDDILEISIIFQKLFDKYFVKLIPMNSYYFKILKKKLK